jgi:hypothetical protein
MKLTADIETFDKYQKAFIREIIEQIRFKLAEAGYRGDEVRDLTGEIAFSVASSIDDTAMIEVEGTDIHPYITFRTEDDQLLHCGEKSYMHEYVAGLIGEIFDN